MEVCPTIFSTVICICLVPRKISTLSVAKLIYFLIGKRKAIILSPWFSIQQLSGGVIPPEKDFSASNGFEKGLLVSRYHLGHHSGENIFRLNRFYLLFLFKSLPCAGSCITCSFFSFQRAFILGGQAGFNGEHLYYFVFL